MVLTGRKGSSCTQCSLANELSSLKHLSVLQSTAANLLDCLCPYWLNPFCGYCLSVHLSSIVRFQLSMCHRFLDSTPTNLWEQLPNPLHRFWTSLLTFAQLQLWQPSYCRPHYLVEKKTSYCNCCRQISRELIHCAIVWLTRKSLNFSKHSVPW